jgi:hypothetical protein
VCVRICVYLFVFECDACVRVCVSGLCVERGQNVKKDTDRVFLSKKDTDRVFLSRGLMYTEFA